MPGRRVGRQEAERALAGLPGAGGRGRWAGSQREGRVVRCVSAQPGVQGRRGDGHPCGPPAFPASFCGPSLGVADVEEQLSVEESLKQHAMAKLTPRFTLSDIAQNPELAKAAKLELAGQRKSDGTENLSSCDAQSRVTEMEHVRFATDTADRDAERELQAGMEQVDVLLKRLEAGRRSVEQMLKFVQKLYQANVAYSRAMMNAARAAVSSMGTSADWKCASDGISELPMVVGGAHSQISQVLVECTAKLQGSLKASRLLSDELTSTSAKIQSDIAASRSALAKALVLHERAAHAFGMSLDQGISRSHDKQKDPWLTEGRLAAGHSELLEAQHSYRAFLADAFKRVRDAEAYRLVMIKSSMATVLRSHGPTYEEQVSPFVSELTRVVGEVSAEGEVEDLEEGANMHEDSALALGTQRKEEKTLMCGDLFSSPDIIRQGDLEMQAAGDSKWSKGHFVLTQSGFLYGFIGEARSGPVPTFSMALMRCSFEEGEAPVFSITDGGLGWMRGRGRTIRLKAPSVNECCEWAIVMRETIAILQGRL
ncbi:unnamed protein product [Ostreobium quekettii]|uniref:PH domain-containing protein n=1 Tax=Ostreobium quekettii TaxID=121088 RepID=A0A8S1IM81_9CHLO|nr:unnamed protein product [Ostreobium quekettii]